MYMNMAINYFVGIFFSTRICKILSMDLTINRKNFINPKKVITSFVSNHSLYFRLFSKQNITKTRLIYKIYDNIINFMYQNTTNTVIMRFYINSL